MNQNQQTKTFTVEFGIMLGLALGLSGQFPAAILAFVAWFVLRYIRPATPSAILLVTAIIVAETLLAVVALFIGFASFTFAFEIFAVLAVSLLLFLTYARHWAYILLLHAAYVIIARTLDLYHGVSDQHLQRLVFGAIAVRVIIFWVLISYIRRPSPALVEPSASPPNDPGTI